jgi:hypothetical protein
MWNIYLGMLSGLLPMLFLGQIYRYKMNLTHTKDFCEKHVLNSPYVK